jgi:hypothetical protein
MTPERITSLPTRMLALDTETYRILAGLLAPKLVVGSIGWLAPGPKVEGVPLSREHVAEVFARVLEDPEAVFGGANAPFDILVLAVYFAGLGIDVMPQIFAMLEGGRVYDLQIAEALHAIAEGTLGRDPRTGGELENPETGKRGRYSLATCVDLTLGRTDAKANDAYRLRFDEFDGMPLEQIPQEARDYMVDDARNTGECILAQTGHLPKTSAKHEWGNMTAADGSVYNACISCGATRFGAVCYVRKPHRNLYGLADQVYSACVLHFGAAWGFAVDQASVDVVERHARRRRARLITPFIEAHVFREDGSEDRAVLKRMVAIAYGATEPCPVCGGAGKIPKLEQKTLQCPDCKGRVVPWRSAGKVREPTVTNCARCANTGRVPHPKPDLRGCVSVAAPDDGGDEDARHPGEMTCDSTGFVLTDDVPRSKSGAVGFGRDALHESGDEFLMKLGEFKEDEKILKDYIPFLRTARVPVNGHLAECDLVNPAAQGKKKKRCHCPGPYRDITLTLRPNVALETLRVSYDGYIMLLPRAPGFIDSVSFTVDSATGYALHTAHGLNTGDGPVQTPSGGTTDYWIICVDPDHFQLASSRANALAGIAVGFTDAGTGTQKFMEYVPSIRECIVARGPQTEVVEVPDDYELQPGESVYTPPALSVMQVLEQAATTGYEDDDGDEGGADAEVAA